MTLLTDQSRLSKLLDFDRQYAKSYAPKTKNLINGGTQMTFFAQPATGIIGVDEVGRGCLAGPVMAGAVMLPMLDQDSGIAAQLAKLNDSKQLSASHRDHLASTIRACSWYGIGSASPAEIDEINILQACHLAMRRAVQSLLASLPSCFENPVVLVDGRYPIKDLDCEQVAVPKGDTKSASIAAASIVAKVVRDALISQLAIEYPLYGWQQNKGYPSDDHRQAISEHGRCQWHRQSFYSTTDKQLRLQF